MANDPPHRSRTFSRRRILSLGAGVLGLAAVGCSARGPSNAPENDGPAGSSATAQPNPSAESTAASSPTSTGQPPDLLLHYTIGLHIEPFGTTAQGFKSSRLDYADRAFFAHAVEDIRTLAAIVERHGGRMTVQAQSPFTTEVIRGGDPILRDLAAAGHEIALHFHEDAHLGGDADALPVDRWVAVLEEELSLLRAASGVNRVRSWSGGNTYRSLYAAAAAVDLDVNSDWKNRQTQSTPPELLGTCPWRPAGGTDGIALADFARHDRTGPIVFLPHGVLGTGAVVAGAGNPATTVSDDVFLAATAEMVHAALAAADPARINVCHLTIHPGEFRGSAADPFGVVERFLTRTIDPLLAAGRLRWSTFAEMADAFIAWEAANPNVPARPSAATPLRPPSPTR